MRRFYTLLSGIFAAQIAAAQISEGGLPPSFLPENQAAVAARRLEPTRLAAPDLEKTRAEDAASPIQDRFAVPMTTDVSPENSGAWMDLPDGQRLWRCQLTAAGARGLVLMFDRFRLPPGGRFFVYDAGQRSVLGAFTEKSCRPDGRFLAGPVPGETAILEYLEPADAPFLAEIRLNRADYAYVDVPTAEVAGLLGFGDALPCHTNVACQVASNFYLQRRGVARILMVFSNGTGWCSGSFVANTSGTGDPYFLTAHHCQIIANNPDFSMWRFDFGYESPTCQNPTTEPAYKSVLGCQRMAYRAETDFLLLKTSPIPQDYNPYFNAWDRSADAPLNSSFIHHPKGDLKKYSADAQPAEVFDQSIAWGGQFGTSPAGTHFITIPETGTFQSGSSGCPLFSPEKRIVGQLHGGNANASNPCFVNNTYFGMFSQSWDAGSGSASRLRDWLDPTGTNKMIQEGYIPPPPPPSKFAISGRVQTAWGMDMGGVRVNLTGDATKSTTTDINGKFAFDSLDVGKNYTLTPVRDTNDLNGVSTFDLLNISKHVLGVEPFDTPWKILAADANLSNSVTSFDILEYRKALLGIYPNGFPTTPSWRFFPASSQFSTPALPFPAPDGSLSIQDLQADKTDANFVGVKMGDTNNSANAGQ